MSQKGRDKSLRDSFPKLGEAKRLTWSNKERHRKMDVAKREILAENAKALRKSMTKEERKLWYDFFKRLPVTINRQKVIGNYIVDFYCASAKIVIELDGSQHYEEKGKEADNIRDTYLQSLGLTVLRYSNSDVNKNFTAVCEDIYIKLPIEAKIQETTKCEKNSY